MSFEQVLQMRYDFASFILGVERASFFPLPRGGFHKFISGEWSLLVEESLIDVASGAVEGEDDNSPKTSV